ncbi:hypothetical protein KCU71_g77, partial [Aureobasidium melanogenum]
MSRLTATGQAANINWFQEVQRMFRVPAHKREHIDLTSAYFRITLMLACTVLHELVHAFSNAYFENSTPLAQPREPWIRGTRCNEQGCCFEQHSTHQPQVHLGPNHCYAIWCFLRGTVGSMVRSTCRRQFLRYALCQQGRLESASSCRGLAWKLSRCLRFLCGRLCCGNARREDSGARTVGIIATVSHADVCLFLLGIMPCCVCTIPSLQLIGHETLVLTVFADSGAAASDDLALDLASSAGRARLLQRIVTRGGGGGSSTR